MSKFIPQFLIDFEMKILDIIFDYATRNTWHVVPIIQIKPEYVKQFTIIRETIKTESFNGKLTRVVDEGGHLVYYKLEE